MTHNVGCYLNTSIIKHQVFHDSGVCIKPLTAVLMHHHSTKVTSSVLHFGNMSVSCDANVVSFNSLNVYMTIV